MPQKPLHPTFRKKYVLKLSCKYCSNCVCLRGMKAILLADTSVELFSTDLLPGGPGESSIELVNDPFQTEKCKCIIKDVACLVCGNIVGYSVVHPCQQCLQSCNNGHYLMFYSNAIESQERLDRTGTNMLLWGHLDDDEKTDRESETTDVDFLR